MSTPSGSFGRGLAASLSIVAGYTPIAFSFGLAAVQGGVPLPVIVLASVIVFAGASQFALIGLLGATGAGWATVPTVLLMNARHLLYGPPIVQRLDGTRLPPSPLLAFGLTDEVFATALTRLQTVPVAERGWWFVGLQTGAYASWVGGTIAGVQVGHGLIETWPRVAATLDFMLAALFIALLVEMGLRAHLVPVLAAGTATALALQWLPSHLAIPAGIGCGVLAALLPSSRPAESRE